MNSSNNNTSQPGKPNGGPSIDLKAEQSGASASGAKQANQSQTASTGPQPAAPELKARGKGNLHPLAAAMQEKWSKLSDSDLDGVKSQDDLTAKVAGRYGIASDLAKSQVQAWAQGRAF